MGLYHFPCEAFVEFHYLTVSCAGLNAEVVAGTTALACAESGLIIANSFVPLV